MEGDMYNIAITKEKKTDFFNGADDQPRQYPTLADALVSAQYLGLTRQDVELHFVKNGATIDTITQTAKELESGKKQKKPFEKMNREQLVAYAAEKEIAINPEGTKAEILVAIQAANEQDIKIGEDDEVTQEDKDPKS